MKKTIWLFCFFILLGKANAYEYEVSVGTIFQNEAPYLKEWLDYHLYAGVDHFFLYNNESTDDWQKVLQPYMEAGIVEVKNWPNLWPDVAFAWGCQIEAYKDLLQKAKGKTEWLCIIDTDEFVLPIEDISLKECLHNHFQNSVAIYANWLQFGTSNITLETSDQMLLKLTRCACAKNHWNRVGKSIVKPDYVKTCDNPHICRLIDGYTYMNGDATRKNDSKNHSKYLRINHYTFRDEFFFWNVKLERCDQWSQPRQDIMLRHRHFNKCENHEIINFINRAAHLLQKTTD